jgi:uncharacterized protein
MITTQRGLAIITGAAGGLGSSFARKLAQQGYRLLLVDRRQAQLQLACESIATRYDVSVESCAVDLCRREEVERLGQQLEQIPDVELLVNNAGFGTAEYFADTDLNYLVGMVDLHVVAPTILTRAVLPTLVARDTGGIINVSSLSAWFQSAGNTQYSSTKNYLAVFSTALREELRGTNVRVQALCPGFVRTEFHDAECMKGFKLRCAPAAHLWMTPDEVVDYSLRCFSSNRVVVIPGMGYRILGRLAQMPMLQPLMQRITRLPRNAQSSPQTVDLDFAKIGRSGVGARA